MLFFELFPAALMIASFVIGIALFVADRRASKERQDDPRRPGS